jgi:hypothetical protein
LAPSETTAQHHSPAPQPSTQLKGALLCFVVSKEHREFIGSVTQLSSGEVVRICVWSLLVGTLCIQRSGFSG